MAKQRGGLVYPTRSVFRVIVLTDQAMQRAIRQSDGAPPTDSQFLNKLLCTVSMASAEDRLIFPDLYGHDDSNVFDCLHVSALIKQLACKFAMARLGLLNSTATIGEHSAASVKRNQATRLLIFKGL